MAAGRVYGGSAHHLREATRSAGKREICWIARILQQCVIKPASVFFKVPAPKSINGARGLQTQQQQQQHILVTPPDPKERGGPAQTPYIVVLANEVQRSNT